MTGLTPEQHAERRTGIGGSDAPAALGLSFWKTPLELWMEKTERVQPEDLYSIREPVRWGVRLEDAIARGWSEDHGIPIRRVNQTLRHPEHPFMICHLDRRQVGKRRGLEVKNTSIYMADHFGDPDSDDVPLFYWIQGQHQNAITNALWGWDGTELAALVGGNELRSYTIDHDPEFIAEMIPRLRRFWQYVEDDEAPPPINTADLDLLFAKDDGEIREATDPAIVAAWEELHHLKDERKGVDRQINELEFKLKNEIREASGISYGGARLATWKAQSRTWFDQKRFAEDHPKLFERYSETRSSRVLRLDKRKD